MKDVALALIKGAGLLFPPIGELLHRALDSLLWDEPREIYDLAKEVREALPPRSETRKALDDLKGPPP